MIRIGSFLVIREVATDAGRSRQIVVVVRMAIAALTRGHGMRVGQRKSHQVMIEFRVQPGIGRVAILAGDREICGNVIRRVAVQKFRLMAGITLRRHRLESALGSAFVAGIAVDSRVSSGQWETIIVILDLLHGNGPSTHRVALLAVGAQLAAVNVSVAVLALGAHVREHRLHVTLGAGHGLVHSAQWIPRLVVIKLRYGADRPPGCRCMTVLASNVQIAVRAVCARRLPVCVSNEKDADTQQCGRMHYPQKLRHIRLSVPVYRVQKSPRKL